MLIREYVFLVLFLGCTSTAFSAPICTDKSSDPDRDGWGWENEESCIVEGTSLYEDNSHSSELCVDTDGDGWGWDGDNSCSVDGKKTVEGLLIGREAIAASEILDAEKHLMDDDPTNDHYWRMIYDMGGVYEFGLWKETSSDEEISAMYQSYGMDYINKEPPDDALLKGERLIFEVSKCTGEFASYARNRTYWTGTHDVSVDYRGHPSAAEMNTILGYIYSNRLSLHGRVASTGRRDEECQGIVNSFANSFIPNERRWHYRYAGGHLIGDQFGGYGRRANMVPQSQPSNNSFSSYVEKYVKQCMTQKNSIVRYRVTPRYSYYNNYSPRQLYFRTPSRLDVEVWVSVIPTPFLRGNNSPRPWDLDWWRNNSWFELTPLKVSAKIYNYTGSLNSNYSSKRELERFAGLISQACVL